MVEILNKSTPYNMLRVLKNLCPRNIDSHGLLHVFSLFETIIIPDQGA